MKGEGCAVGEFIHERRGRDGFILRGRGGGREKGKERKREVKVRGRFTI